jgi:tellurite resistance-related uncharacterized protein
MHKFRDPELYLLSRHHPTDESVFRTIEILEGQYPFLHTEEEIQSNCTERYYLIRLILARPGRAT